MMTTGNTESSAKWPVLWLILAMMASTTLLFWLTPLDLRVEAAFHVEGAEAGQAWPVKQQPFVQFCYKAAPALTLLIALPALLIVLIGGLSDRIRRWRAHAGVVVLTVMLGPGLLVNGLFKDHWDRPRPVQTVNFGGAYPYTPPLMIGPADEGKSFPCGHCSAGFALAALWLLLRRRRPALAWVALAVSIALGASMGFSRMAAGGHYLSDVLWAAWLSFFAAWLSYYVILRIPEREAGRLGPARPWPRPVLWTAYGVAGTGVVVGALLATPVELRWKKAFDLPAGEFVLAIEHARPELVLVAANHGRMEVEADWQGFGLPGAKLVEDVWETGLRLRPEGVFTELRDQVRVRATLGQMQFLRLELSENQRLQVRCEGGFERLPLILNLPPERVRFENCTKP